MTDRIISESDSTDERLVLADEHLADVVELVGPLQQAVREAHARYYLRGEGGNFSVNFQ